MHVWSLQIQKRFEVLLLRKSIRKSIKLTTNLIAMINN